MFDSIEMSTFVLEEAAHAVESLYPGIAESEYIKVDGKFVDDEFMPYKVRFDFEDDSAEFDREECADKLDSYSEYLLNKGGCERLLPPVCRELEQRKL